MIIITNIAVMLRKVIVVHLTMKISYLNQRCPKILSRIFFLGIDNLFADVVKLLSIVHFQQIVSSNLPTVK